MDWTVVGFTLIPALVLLSQGLTCLRGDARPFVRVFGGFAVALSALAFLLTGLLLRGTLVPSFEFGLVMVQGSLAWYVLAAVIAGFAIAAGIGWHAARVGADCSPRLGWLLVGGTAVGAAAFYDQFIVVNPGDLPHLRVYAYDLLWPPLLMWLAVAFADGSLTILGAKRSAPRAWLATGLVAGLAFWALDQPRAATSTSAATWENCLRIVLPVTFGLTVWLVLSALPGTEGHRRVFAMIAIIAGGAALAWLVNRVSIPVLMSPWLLVVYPVIGAVVWGRHSLQWLKRPGPVPAPGEGNFRRALIVVALVVVALALGDLFYFGRVDPLLDLLVFLGAWIVIAEMSTSGPFAAAVRIVTGRELADPASPARRWMASVSNAARTGGSATLRTVRAIVALDSAPVAIVKVIAAVALVVAIMELTHAGRTLVQPFTGPDIAGQPSAGRASWDSAA